MLNCAELWKLTWTFMGSCLALDVERAYKIEQRRALLKLHISQVMTGSTGTTGIASDLYHSVCSLN